MKRQKVIELDCVDSKKLDIDWENVLAEEDVPELEIIGSNKTPVTCSGEDSAPPVQSLDDNQIDDELNRRRSILSALSDRLPDNGEKIRTRIGNLEYEKQRRLLRRTKMDPDKCQILSHSKSSDVFRQAETASKETSRQWNIGSKILSRSRSTFGAQFSENPKMDAQPVNLFDEELQDLGSGSWKGKAGRETKTNQSNGWRSMPSLRKSQGVEFESIAIAEFKLQEDDKLINLDEDEPHSPMAVEEAFELPEGLPEDICYPSRDDPDLVQLSLKDLKCLSPREYLTSPVINFYIRFLQHQVFSENQTAANSHFFNTFFYKKLIEAVSYKKIRGPIDVLSFIPFLQKVEAKHIMCNYNKNREKLLMSYDRFFESYDSLIITSGGGRVLIYSVNHIFLYRYMKSNLHWSLVIICIPDRDDESGLTVIHLDSLGYHPREIIFDNVKRFLREEWNYVNQDALSLDLPISGEIWRDFPNRIIEAEVQVPQQKNDCDCGLFVLFFIKRFIEEAPERLKLEDLGMIHKKWFKPDEASALRFKIWNKLIDLFRNSNQTD
ncbi:unnamed protein product [Arabis nemorensis]|uniref:Ubiquitin-like protease family profile domain-containing protein n=1 Tax=Arabis nemorensis TaxID=586526 RepID=A0A565AQF7_9BRAS|nr:unnamed protein product [Arabis nemorensis]